MEKRGEKKNFVLRSSLVVEGGGGNLFSTKTLRLGISRIE